MTCINIFYVLPVVFITGIPEGYANTKHYQGCGEIIP